MNRSHRVHWAWLVPVLLLVTFLTIRLLNYDLLWGDEARTYQEANLPPYSPLNLIDLLGDLLHRWLIPLPSYFVLVNVWQRFVGDSPFAIRALSMLLGLLTIAATYRLGRALAGRQISLYAAAFMAGSGLFVFYMHEARPYALLLLLSVITAWAYWRLAIHRAHGWLTWALFAIALVALIYTHYLAVMTPLALGLFHLLQRPRDRRWWQVVMTLLAAGLSIVPWASVGIPNVMRAVSDGRDVLALSPPEIVAATFHAFANGGVAISMLLIALALWRGRFGNASSLLLVLIWLLTGFSLVIVINNFTLAFIHVRYLLPLWTPLALLSAYGVYRLAQRGVPALLPVFLWLGVGTVAAWTLDFATSLPNSETPIEAGALPDVIAMLRVESAQGDFIAFHIAEPGTEQAQIVPLEHYLQWLPVSFVQLGQLGSVTEADYRQEVQSLVTNAPLVWVVHRTDIPPAPFQDVFTAHLAEDYILCDQWQADSRAEVAVYANANPDAPDVTYPLGDDGSEIALWLHRARRYDPGIGMVTAGWHVTGANAETYAVALHLVDEAGKLIRQSDEPLPVAETLACDRHQIDLAGLPIGAYRLELIVYERETGRPLVGIRPADGWQGNRLLLMSVNFLPK